MCGIVGWIGAGAGEAALRAMMDAVAHRGPDGSGTAFLDLGENQEAAFGHLRLSILDIESGAQPMTSPDGRFTLTYNGEIYNYIELRDELIVLGAAFKTSSDTEVILAAWATWGEGSLSRLRGMFAFALHDALTGSVYLARDGFGKKPLFYADTGDALVFGSEIGALLAHPGITPVLDEASVYDYLSWRYVPGPNTFFEGIKKVAPGTVLVCQNGEIKRRRYWSPPEAVTAKAAPKDPVAEFRKIFDEAVAIRLRSDVPVGMFLSSGIDSAAVLESVSRAGTPVKAFSVGYSDQQISELEAAGDLAAEFGAPFEPIYLEPSGLLDRISEMTRARAAPVSEPADVPVYVMSQRASQDVKVVLTGEGADELFAGYPKHAIEARLGGLGALRSAAGQIAGRLGDRRLRVAGKALRTTGFEHRMIQWFGAMSADERQAVWKGKDVIREMDGHPFETLKGASALRRILHFDQTSWLPDNVLERGDRMTMAASIELRAPFMDKDLAAFSARLPDTWRLKGRVTKRVLREAMVGRLPQSVLTRKKKGFPVPISDWFRGNLKDALSDTLCAPDAMIAQYLDPSWIAGVLEAHNQGDTAQDKLLWMLFSLELFLQNFFGQARQTGRRT